MTHSMVIDLARNAVLTMLMLAGPLLMVALGVGLVISIVQAVTQIQEQTLSFVPKLAAIMAVLLLGMPWMMQVMVRYTTELFRSLPMMVR
jgi:flagellar biosynthesis protein FliQ